MNEARKRNLPETSKDNDENVPTVVSHGAGPGPNGGSGGKWCSPRAFDKDVKSVRMRFGGQ